MCSSLNTHLVTLFGLVHFEDWTEGVLVLGFPADGFLTRLAIFSLVKFLVVVGAPPFTQTFCTLGVHASIVIWFFTLVGAVIFVRTFCAFAVESSIAVCKIKYKRIINMTITQVFVEKVGKTEN